MRHEEVAILTVTSGANGLVSQDWAEMLARMYRRWAERRGFDLEIIEYTEGEERGINSATFSITGENAFGLLSAERGVHRMRRINPLDPGARIHTAFASVRVSSPGRENDEPARGGKKRTYTLQPYRLIVDHDTGGRTEAVEEFLDGKF